MQRIANRAGCKVYEMHFRLNEMIDAEVPLFFKKHAEPWLHEATEKVWNKT